MCDKLLQCFFYFNSQKREEHGGRTLSRFRVSLKKKKRSRSTKGGRFIIIFSPAAAPTRNSFSMIVAAREPLCSEKPLFIFATTLDT